MGITEENNILRILSEQQTADFYRDGYLKFGQVISSETVEELRTELDDVIARRANVDAGDLPPEFAYGHQNASNERAGEYSGPAIHQYINMWKVMPGYAKIIHNTRITGAIRDLMNVSRIRLWHDQVISKPPHENKHFANHHDFYFWPLDRPTMITCWLALDDATPENGCMHVVPRSHRDPRYQPSDCDLSEDIFLSPMAGGPEPPGSLYEDIRTWMPQKAVPVRLKAGECMFHHCLNFHMTPENISDRQRRALVMIYMPDGTRYKHAQSPHHICTQHLNLKDGELMDRPEFPLCGTDDEAAT